VDYGYGVGCGYGEGGYGEVVCTTAHGAAPAGPAAPELGLDLGLEEVTESAPEPECERVGRLFPQVPAKTPTKEKPKA
jgi:hypothetical protein